MTKYDNLSIGRLDLIFYKICEKTGVLINLKIPETAEHFRRHPYNYQSYICT